MAKKRGPKPVVFKQHCAFLAETTVLAEVERYLESHRLGDKGTDAQTWRWCADYVTKYGHGVPAQVIESHDDDGKPVVFGLRILSADQAA